MRSPDTSSKRDSNPHFRQTKSGEWVVEGPASLIHTGQISVAKADGSHKTVTVERLGRTFDINGQPFVYGYLAPSTNRTAHARTMQARSDRCPTGGDCWSFPQIAHCHSCGK